MARVFKRRSARCEDAVFCSVASMCEAGILASTRWEMQIITIVVLHCAVVVGLLGCLVTRIRSEGDTATLALAVVATGSTGPIGAFGCTILAWLGVFITARGFALRTRHKGFADTYSEHPAAVLANRIQSGRAMDPRAPVPECLETALTLGPPAHRKAALYRLSTKYHPALTEPLRAALASGLPPTRTPANAIFATLLERAVSEAGSLAHRPIETAAKADQVVSEARLLLLRLPLHITALPICEMVAREMHALCQRILRTYPGHRSAVIVNCRALIILKRYQEADNLLRDLGENDDEDARGLRLECLARLGRYKDFGTLRARTMSSGAS
jgi:hypothetical protein